MNKFEQEYELYYKKYGEIAPVFEGVPNPCTGLQYACYKVVECGAGWQEMAYCYSVDEQQLYDFVKCQRLHNRWLDRLDEARYIGA